MKDISNFSHTRHLYRVLFVMMLVLAGVAWSGWQSLGRVSALAERADASRTPLSMRINWIEVNVTRMSLQLRQAIDSRAPVYLAATEVDMQDKRQLIEEALQALDAGVMSSSDRDALAQIKTLSRRFLQACDDNLKLVQQGHAAQAVDHLLSHTMPVRNQLLVVLNAEKRRQNGLLDGELDALRKDADATRKQLTLLGIALAIGLALFYWYIADVLYRSKLPTLNMPRMPARSRGWLAVGAWQAFARGRSGSGPRKPAGPAAPEHRAFK